MMKNSFVDRHNARCLIRCFTIVCVFTVSVLPCDVFAQDNNSTPQASSRPMKIEDLFRFGRVAAPNVSPDETMVVYQLSEIVDAKKNVSCSCIYIAPVDGSSKPRKLTNTDKRDSSPKFSPDGKHVLFESNRSGSSQLWLIAVDGGEAKQLTDIATEAGNAIWSPDGTKIAFASAVYPEFTSGSDEKIAKANADRLKSESEKVTKVRTFDRLFYRHWDSYVEGKRQHLFVLKLKQDDSGLVADGAPHDATPGDRDAVPTSSTFSSGKDYCFSPDSSHLIFSAPPTSKTERSLEAWSTNYDLCRVSIDNKSSSWETLTANPAADSGPQISPDGSTLAWRSQRVAGAEADRWLISTQSIEGSGKLIDKPTEHKLVDDISVGEFAWADSRSILFTAEWKARHRIYEMHLDNPGKRETVIADNVGAVGDLSALPDDALLYTQSTLKYPNEIFVRDKAGNERNLSQVNSALLSEFELAEPQWTMEVPIEDGLKMQMWILTPPGFDSTKKYPTIYLVHGGPQGAWGDSWSFRWNPVLWAAQGYVVACPNPRGSTGFGQNFTDQISGDWGGKCYRDLMAGADYVANLPYVDSKRMAAAGASFGGYMMNWFAVNTDRFCTLVTHCSVYNFESMWGSTDELWFDEFEHGGKPWERPESYRKFSPQAYAKRIAEFKTPMLVIHNDLDFRCPIGQGIELFTTLQRLNVPSRFVNFPDEGHWVTKPANSQLWHEEVFNWLESYCKQASR